MESSTCEKCFIHVVVESCLRLWGDEGRDPRGLLWVQEVEDMLLCDGLVCAWLQEDVEVVEFKGEVHL